MAALVVVVCTFIVAAAIQPVLRFLTRRAVRRATEGRGRWRLRLPRVNDGARTEQRRIQRADAAAQMMSRISTVILFALAALIVARILGVDPVFLLSSAGFVGVGLAFGGQALIHDWITGLIVLLEDRYAVGDLVKVRVGSDEVTGTVETLGGAGLRLRLADGATWHGGHGSIDSVINLSQQLVTSSIDVPSDSLAGIDEAELARQLDMGNLDLGFSDVLVAPAVDAEQISTGMTRVTVRASRPLNKRQKRAVAERIARGRVTGGKQPANEP